MEITPEVLYRLKSRIKVEDFGIDEVLKLDNQVQLGVDVTNIMRNVQIETVTKDLSGGGATTFWTVPKDEEWDIVIWYRQALVAGSRPYINDGTSYLYTRVASAGSYTDSYVRFMVPGGWIIGHEGTGNGGDNAVVMTLLVSKLKLNK